MDFGSEVFDGNARWLEVGVRPGDLNDSNAYTTLTPRQQVTPTPYALHTRGIFVDTAGKVGIGTTSPYINLDVTEEKDGLVGMYITNTSTAGSSAEAIYFGDENGWSAGIRLNDDLSVYPSQMHIFNNRTGGSIQLRTNSMAQMVVDDSGNVGIGTTSPTQKLDVVGNVTASLYYDRDDTSHYVDPSGTSDVHTITCWDLYASDSWANDLTVAHDLVVQHGVKMPFVYGFSVLGRDVQINSAGDLGTLLSSKRFKENIVPLEDDFSKILGARPVTFTWKESKEPDIGLIAEDIDELGLPNLVFYDAEGKPESVRYKFVSLYLLEVIKDQANAIEDLQAQNESLKQRLDKLESSVHQLVKVTEVQL